MIFRPRKFAANPGDLARPKKLQWSRDLSTTEIGTTPFSAMGYYELLQWSRDLSTTEIHEVEIEPDDTKVLQWSRDLSTTEITWRETYRCQAALASMEP